MKKICLTLMTLAAIAMIAAPAWAVPAFNEAFKTKYVKPGSPIEAKVTELKCNVCHVGKDKKDRNEYGKAVGKFLKKGDFAGDTKKFDPKSDEGKAELDKGLTAAEAEKSAGGKTFGEILKAGEVPQ